MAEADAVPDLSKVVCMFCLNAEGLQDPKSLPCTHIYCLKCVTRYYQFNGIIRCPLCRENFDETPQSLPSAYQVAVVDDSILCDVCTKKGLEKKPAVTYCTVCSKLYCAKHQHAHDDLNEEHFKMNINVYKLKAKKLVARYCTEHADTPYSMGCRTCLKPMCVKCISSGGTCTNAGSAHQLLTLDELVEELTNVDQIQDKEDKLEDLFKLMSNIIADFDTETEALLKMLHKQRDLQLEAIQQKYAKLENELLKLRGKTKSDMVDFMEEDVGVKLSDLYISRMKIEAKLAHNHQVDIISGYAEIKDKIQELLSEVIPKLELPDMISTLEVKGKKRDVEIEVVSAGSGCVSLEQGLVITPPPPPKSIKLVRTVEVSEWCTSVCEYQGITYVGLASNAGVDRIDKNNKLTKSFLTLNGHVDGITVYKDAIYTLVNNEGSYSVNVHQLTGERITSWSAHTDSRYFNKLVIINNQIVIPDPKNQQLMIYSLPGELVASLPCPLLTDRPTALCTAESNSVIISNHSSSLVFKVDIVTGEVLWECDQLQYPRGVTCYRSNYVLVASYGTTATIWVLDMKTGKLVTTITDPTVRSDTGVYDLHISGDTLIVPRHNEKKVLFYQLD